MKPLAMLCWLYFSFIPSFTLAGELPDNREGFPYTLAELEEMITASPQVGFIPTKVRKLSQPSCN